MVGASSRVRRARELLGPLRRAVVACAVLWSGVASAAGPRWVTGPPYFTTQSQAVVWYTNSPVYFTDPGDLSPSVNHAAADALVAAAAGVWNVPTSALALAQGGQLAEHVSGENVYLGANGLVFPGDVTSANYAAIQIAVVYDTDGSVTELVLGQGASDPANCQQNGVTESVDAITPAGKIEHALLILNGRCTGPAVEQQLQLRYQLMRAFGRVLGLGWSQTNDNVFTGSPQPTAEDYNRWPIMHPIDIVCGPYTYQCLPNPFTLRPDDVASISQLYFIAKGTAPADKLDTLSNASAITGILTFGNGQGMQGVNVLVRRHFPASTFADEAAVVSAVTGNLYRWSDGNPVTGPSAPTIADSMGNLNPPYEGEFDLGMVPELPNTEVQDAYMTTEAINPLYTGQYGIGPYEDAPVTPSGPSFFFRDNGLVPYRLSYYALAIPGSAGGCDTSGLGSKSSPMQVAASGWTTGSLCEYGVSAWSQFAVQANRSLTVEATALDEQGLVTENKLQPLIGVWNAGDPPDSPPTLAAAATPFNSIAAGLTGLTFATSQTGTLRVVVTDEHGDGRPDYNFRARVLYADSISPAAMAAGGGLVTITGMGFRAGLQVTVGGVAAVVVSSTANTILAMVPPFAELGTGAALTEDVGVTDPMSGGSTYLYGALTYPATALPAQSAAVALLPPTSYIAAGRQVGLVPLAGISASGAAVPGVTVSWAAVSGAIAFPSGAQSVSDANGIASIAAAVGPLAPAGKAVGSACASLTGVALPVCGQFMAIGVDPSLWTITSLEGAGQSVASASVLQPVVFQVTDGAGDPVIGAPVTIYQAVTSWVVCPATGDCPIAATYETAQSSGVSDGNGLVVVVPEQIAGTSERTKIAVSVGTQGFAAATLSKTP